MKKRFISSSLAALMVFSLLSTSALAMENGIITNDSSFVPLVNFLEPDVTTTHVNGFTVEDVAPLDLSGIDSSNIIELPDSEVAVHAVSSESESASALNNENVAFDVNLSNLENAESLDDSIILSSPMTRTSAYTMASMSNVMGEGETQHLYTITVPNGYIIQAELQVPRNLSLDYSLYLCTYDANDSSLTIVSGSDYATNSNFLAENVCSINNSGSDVIYYIIVDSNNNPSTEDYYTINVSLGGTADETAEKSV